MNESIPNFSDYLREYLAINYPFLASDNQFISNRNKLAQKTFMETMNKCGDYDLANELAMDTLLKNYKFSKYYCILDILLDEYQSLFSRDILEDFAMRFMPACESVFQKYTLCDSLLRDEIMFTLKGELKDLIKQKMNEYWDFEV